MILQHTSLQYTIQITDTEGIAACISAANSVLPSPNQIAACFCASTRHSLVQALATSHIAQSKYVAGEGSEFQPQAFRAAETSFACRLPILAKTPHEGIASAAMPAFGYHDLLSIPHKICQELKHTCQSAVINA